MKFRNIGFGFVLVVFVALCASLRSDPGAPVQSRIFRLEPDTGKPGEIISAYGEQLDNSKVQELMLRSSECAALVTIIQQNQILIRFRIPQQLPFGRYAVVILPAGGRRNSVEQPVTLQVR